jgi:transposase
MITADIHRIDLNMKELQGYLDQARSVLGEDAYKKLTAALETLAFMTDLVGDKDMTIQRLQRIIFGGTTEKTRNALNKQTDAAASSGERNDGQENTAEGKKEKENKRPKGHGRNGARDYTGAQRVKVPHESLKPGDHCPLCLKGKVYAQKTPAYIVRLVGRAPIGATVYEKEILRCNLCLEVFTAATPEGVGPEKYDPSAGAIIAALRYGSGFPFHRLERLQGNMGIPLPASTQWGIVLDIFRITYPAFQELIRQAAQGQVLYNDDTKMRILALMGKGAQQQPLAESDDGSEKPERTGIFTSGIVSTHEGREIALFFTGRKYAGENLNEVLKQRASEIGPPIQMCDGLLSRNLPKEFEVILSNCNAHARRGFFDAFSRFPDECRYVLETLRDVYKNDAVAKERRMSDEERLAYHQAQSGPLMERLEKWLDEQIAEKKVEPNSNLGDAISYMKKHWKALVQFLHVPGAPLDNTICERALKKAILHRKGSLFYKTQNGADVGDLFMSLIYTCERCGADSVDYLVELQKHATELVQHPEAWMPWNYRETLERGRASSQSD